jgi:hypothetical protein
MRLRAGPGGNEYDGAPPTLGGLSPDGCAAAGCTRTKSASSPNPADTPSGFNLMGSLAIIALPAVRPLSAGRPVQQSPLRQYSALLLGPE